MSSRGGSAGSDKRVAPRNKLRKVGRILCASPHKVLPCIILDLSETGALLLVHDAVPDRFALYYSAEQTLRDVVVVRRQVETCGVRFEGEPVKLAAGDPRLAELRR